jgi:phosphohistidine phosphatase SixA
MPPLFPLPPSLRLCCARCRPTALLVRHADVAPGGGNPPLTVAGQTRAAALAHAAGSAGVSTIIVSSLLRTQQTAAPAAAALGITPDVVTEPADILAAIAARPVVSTVLVVGHTNTVPGVISGMNGPAVTIGETEFDNLFVLARGHLTHLRYGA